VKIRGDNRRNRQKNSWKRERKVGQERAKQVNICEEKKREISINDS
jgi:hypothetical protein